MARVRSALAVLFLVAGSGCDSPNPSHLACPRSVDEFCAIQPAYCIRTWDEVQSGQVTCLETFDPYEVEDCGGYRKLAYVGADLGAAYYFDATTGQLVAIVGTIAVGREVLSCDAGPSTGFTIPSCPRVDGGWEAVECNPDATGI
jgi:hypothetical protein